MEVLCGRLVIYYVVDVGVSLSKDAAETRDLFMGTVSNQPLGFTVKSKTSDLLQTDRRIICQSNDLPFKLLV